MSQVNSNIQSASSKKLIDKDLLSACIHCGLCLPACPTYLATGREMESPRGRIYLLNKLNEGELALTSRLSLHIDSCLGCLGCQTACPSGVNYESILNQARPHMAKLRNPIETFVLRIAFKYVLPNYALLVILGSLLRTYQNLQRKQLDSRLPKRLLFKRFAAKIAQWQALLPEIPNYKQLPAKYWRSGPKKGIAQLFCGCVMNIFYNPVNHAAVRLLVAQSWIVENSPQTCCGALAFHAGETEIAQALACRNITFFEKTTGPIVVTASGCGAMLKQYKEILNDKPQWRQRAKAFSERVQDVTETLATGEFKRLPQSVENSIRSKIAYHAACHLAHAQNVRAEPELLLKRYIKDMNLIRKMQEVQLVPLNEAEHCCGSAGIYNLLNPEMSLAVLQRKLVNIEKTGADLVVTTNPGCQLQLEAGLRNAGLKVQVKHLCELLDQFYCSDS